VSDQCDFASDRSELPSRRRGAEGEARKHAWRLHRQGAAGYPSSAGRRDRARAASGVAAVGLTSPPGRCGVSAGATTSQATPISRPSRTGTGVGCGAVADGQALRAAGPAARGSLGVGIWEPVFELAPEGNHRAKLSGIGCVLGGLYSTANRATPGRETAVIGMIGKQQ
jgi:hypothetical protein